MDDGNAFENDFEAWSSHCSPRTSRRKGRTGWKDRGI